jgi:hypothetical protein
MEDTYVLVGLSVLTICCIYLFYLTFKSTREREFLQAQINDLKFVQTSQSQILQNIHQSSMPNPSNIMEMLSSTHSHPFTPTSSANANANANATIVEDNSTDNDKIELAPEDIENIDKLEDQLNELADGNDLGLDEESFDDDIEFDENTVDLGDVDTTPFVEQELNTVTDLDDLDDLDIDAVATLDATADTVTYTKNITKTELENSSVKALKLIAKNCGVSSRGNKEVLISSILKKLGQ